MNFEIHLQRHTEAISYENVKTYDDMQNDDDDDDGVYHSAGN